MGGNIRQTRKNRSSTAKVRQKPKSKKNILNNPIIAANWNQKETFAQNYRRLGLTASLNDATGGTERAPTALIDSDSNLDSDPGSELDDSADPDTQGKKLHSRTQRKRDTAENGLGIKRSKRATQISIAPARVIRDPETGAILSVLDDGDANSGNATSRRANPLNDPLNELESENEEGGVWKGFVNEHGTLDAGNVSSRGNTEVEMTGTNGTNGQTEVVRALIEEASAPRIKKVRKQSQREEEWISKLVDRYGDDYVGMSRDGKLNVYQQSVGDIKRRVLKWHAARGGN